MESYKGSSPQYWWAKAQAYGKIVHGCTPALERAGYSIESGIKGPSASIASAVEDLVTRLENAENALEEERRTPKETSKLTSLDTRILSHLACFEQDLEYGLKRYSDTGDTTSVFCTTPNEAIAKIRNFIIQLRKEVSRVYATNT